MIYFFLCITCLQIKKEKQNKTNNEESSFKKVSSNLCRNKKTLPRIIFF